MSEYMQIISLIFQKNKAYFESVVLKLSYILLLADSMYVLYMICLVLAYERIKL